MSVESFKKLLKMSKTSQQNSQKFSLFIYDLHILDLTSNIFTFNISKPP